MKYIPIFSLMIAPYAFVVFMLCSITVNTHIQAGILLYLLVLLCSAVYALLLSQRWLDGRELLFWNVVIKLCHIPLYLAVFAGVLLTHVLSLPFLPVLIFFDYSLLLASSMYGISGIISRYQSNELSFTAVIVNIAAHLIFCSDVVSALYCYIHTKNNCRSEV